MKQYLAQTTLVVRDYDEAIDSYVNTLGFTLVKDSPVPDPHMPEADKRWVVVAPPGSPGAPESRLLLTKAWAPSRNPASATKPADGTFCSFSPMIFGETMQPSKPIASPSSATNPAPRPMARLPYSGISTATCGT